MKFQGPVPEKLKDKAVDDPLQIELVPDNLTVGLGLTVINAEPVLSADCETQLLSVKDETVYEVEIEGDTLNVYRPLFVVVTLNGKPIPFPPL